MQWHAGEMGLQERSQWVPPIETFRNARACYTEHGLRTMLQPACMVQVSGWLEYPLVEVAKETCGELRSGGEE